MTSMSRISPIAANDVDQNLAESDDFDLALIAVMIKVAQDGLMHLHQRHRDFLDVIERAKRNRRYYQNKKRREQSSVAAGGESGSSSGSSSGITILYDFYFFCYHRMGRW